MEKKVISKENVQNLVEDLPEIILITMVLIKEIMISTPEEAEEAAAAAVELAIEERLERRTEREARHVLFDDLQRGWSDTTFGAERLRLEALDEDDAQTQHEPEVIGVEDRADGSVLADL